VNPAGFAAALAPRLQVAETQDRRISRRQLARERAYFAKVRLAERSYSVALRKIARHVGHIISGFPAGAEAHLPDLLSMLEQYARMLTPWARSAAQRMIAEVARRDEAAWRRLSDTIGRNLALEVRNAPTGNMMRLLQDEQVALITSIPLDAGRRVQALTRELVTGGKRYDEAVPMILASGSVTASRATLIARTETAKAAASLTQARAQHIGSTGYIWRTAHDLDVRPAHKRLDATFHAWDDPPIAEADGQRHHPGNFPNCFVGSTLVGPIPGCLGVFRAFYRGNLVVLKTGNTTIEVTPNHPILTSDGWVAAQFLENGDEVLCIPDQSFNSGMYDMNRRQFPIEQVFKTLCMERKAKRLFIDNFYGDPVDNSVEIIRSEFYLKLRRETSLLQETNNLMITCSNGRIEDANNLRGGSKVQKPSRSSLDNTSNMLFSSFSASDDGILLSLSSHLDSGSFKRRSDSPTLEAISNSDWSNAVSSGVVFDHLLNRHTRSMPASQFDTKIDKRFTNKFPGQSFPVRDLSYRIALQEPGLDSIRVERLRDTSGFTGHVYTMEMLNGYYTAASTGVLTKNCRCWPEPVIPENLD
jgi:SPP1 gp7 family putative phage head morphogenesis protein